MIQEDLFNEGCVLCRAYYDLETHHIDWNHKNNTPENKITLCRRCHTWLHQNGFYNRYELLKLGELIAEQMKESEERETLKVSPSDD